MPARYAVRLLDLDKDLVPIPWMYGRLGDATPCASLPATWPAVRCIQPIEQE